MDYDVTELLWSRLSSSTSPQYQNEKDVCLTASSQVESFIAPSPVMDLKASARPFGSTATTDPALNKGRDQANNLAPSHLERPNTVEDGNLNENLQQDQALSAPFSQPDNNVKQTIPQVKSDKLLIMDIAQPDVWIGARPSFCAPLSGSNKTQVPTLFFPANIAEDRDLLGKGLEETIRQPLTELSRPNHPSSDPKNVRAADISKGPCYRCGFVHRGHQCETECIGCKSTQKNSHSSICPFRHRKALKAEDTQKSPATTSTAAPVAMVRSQLAKPLPPKTLPFKPLSAASVHSRGQSEMAPMGMGLTAAARLSRECQLRGFNPTFRPVDRGSVFGCSVQLGSGSSSTWIYGNRDNFRTEKEAKEAVAIQALAVVRKMPTNRPKVHSETADDSVALSSPTTSKNRPQKPSIPKVDTRTESFSRLSVSGDIRRTNPSGSTMTAVMEKRVEVTPANGTSMPPTISKIASTPRPSVEDRTVAQNRTVDLPGDVQLDSIPGILEKAIANARLSITFNLPGNVSVEVAQAYGKAIGVIARSRSRSRSPRRDQPRNDRRRSRSRSRERLDCYRPNIHSNDLTSDRVDRHRCGDKIRHIPLNDLGMLGTLIRPPPRVSSKDPRGDRVTSRPESRTETR